MQRFESDPAIILIMDDKLCNLVCQWMKNHATLLSMDEKTNVTLSSNGWKNHVTLLSMDENS